MLLYQIPALVTFLHANAAGHSTMLLSALSFGIYNVSLTGFPASFTAIFTVWHLQFSLCYDLHHAFLDAIFPFLYFSTGMFMLRLTLLSLSGSILFLYPQVCFCETTFSPDTMYHYSYPGLDYLTG